MAVTTKLSVIVPVYNVEKYLEQCINSILNQTYTDFELILVDDCSSDSSGAICDEYAGKDDRVKPFHIPRSGVSAARNYGISQATGELIQFVDSDDALEPNCIETVVKDIDQYDVVIFGYKSFPVEIVTSSQKVSAYHSRDERVSSFKELYFKRLINSPCNKVYRKSVIAEHAIRFDSSYSLGEDLLFNLRYLNWCTHILTIPDVLYLYRREKRSSLSTGYRENAIDIQKTLKTETDRFFENDPEIVRCTADDFLLNAFEIIKGTVYHYFHDKNKAVFETQKILNDEYFQKALNQSGTKKHRALRSFSKRKNARAFYRVYTLRKYISDCIHH